MPRLEKAEGLRLIGWLKDWSRFDAERDCFITDSWEEEEVWAGETAILSDGAAAKLYAVGGGSWMWEEEGV